VTFNADEDRRSEMMELSEIAAAQSAKRGQMENVEPGTDGDVVPLLKYCGSKARLVPQILARLPRTCRTYHEPFAGGASVHFAYWRRCSSAVLADCNKELVGFYTAIKRDPAGVQARATYHQRRHCGPWYYEARRRFNAGETELGGVERAGQFLYLNRGGYNGLWRVNKDGGFNVPWNKRDGAAGCHVPTSETFVAAWRALKHTTVVVADFEHTIALAGPGDVVYADPPYVGTFSQYGEGGFGESDHVRLFHSLVSAAGRGAHVLLSNSQASRPIYGAVCFAGVTSKIEEVSVYHAVGAKKERRGNKRELLITYVKE
jgi:DNA adenine methylase